MNHNRGQNKMEPQTAIRTPPPAKSRVKASKYVPTVRHAWYQRAFNSQPKSSFLIHFYSIRLGSIL